MSVGEGGDASAEDALGTGAFDTLKAALDAARSKLLDRSLRNKLIHTNVTSTKARHIRVIDEVSVEILRLLSEGKAMTFAPAAHRDKVESEDEGPQDEGVYVPPADEEDGGASRHTDLKLQTRLTPEGLQKKLLSLYFEGQTLEEEQGVNVLYLALGFLEWREARGSDTRRFAPLILLPVELVRDGARDRFKVKIRPEDLMTNFSLQAWLKEQFGIALPDLPDADDLKADTYFQGVRAAIGERPNWAVHDNEIILGFFSFSKFLLWRDLDPAIWPSADSLLGNPLLSRILLRSKEEGPPDSPLIGDDDRIDEAFRPEQLVHVADADSSQAIAIEEALAGKNLVIQGPPGTGKSQTITNLIAGAVARGKRVLFIAEKMAALDVVHTRLAKAKLGPICLELHSRKAAKTQVLEQIRGGMTSPAPPNWSTKAFEELATTQATLRRYADVLHRPGPNGFTPYELMGKMALLRRAGVATPDFTLPAAADWDRSLIEAHVERAEQLAGRLPVCGTPAVHPWRGVGIATPDLLAQDRLLPFVSGFALSGSALAEHATAAGDLLDADPASPLAALGTWIAALNHLALAPLAALDLLASDQVLARLASISELLDIGERLAVVRPAVEAHQALFDALSPGETPGNLAQAWTLLAERPADADKWLGDADVAAQLPQLTTFITEAEKVFAAGAALADQVLAEALDSDWLAQRKVIAAHGRSPLRWLSKEFRAAVRDLRAVCRKNLPKAHAERLSLLDALIDHRRFEAKLQESAGLLQLLGDLWTAERTDWDRVRSILAWISAAVQVEPVIQLRTPPVLALADGAKSWPSEAGAQRELIARLIECRQLTAKVEAMALERDALGDWWEGDGSDWSALRIALAWISGAQAYEPALQLRRASVLSEAPRASPLAMLLADAIERTSRAFDDVSSEVQLDAGLAFGSRRFDDHSPQEIYALGKSWRVAFERLSEWPQVRDDLQWLRGIDCAAMAERIYDGRLEALHLAGTLEILAYEAVWGRARAAAPELERTPGDELNNLVRRFRAADLDRIRIAADQVGRAHADQRPTGSAGAVGVLKDETKKSKRLKAVRKLVEEAGEAIQRFKPVFLMSPLSVAQFLPPGRLEFDLCVIDEASQVRPEDALGAIARCKQLVVVGDDKQLPPTNFFSRMVSDEDDTDDENEDADGLRAAAVKDVESILNLCSRFPERMLRWHYRSEHPALIATSNRSFYKNQLMLPPSVLAGTGDGETGLVFHLGRQGGYERGKTARNEFEAEDVAQAALRHARQHPDQSLGIGAFSVAQRDCLRDRLEHLAAQHPELDAFMKGGASGEPVFVKNLENIQGDERDVIFISVGYGRDKDGRLTQQFGPIGRDGGERRLNVLITRARKRCEVFSSIVAEDIKTDGAPKPGVQAFKEFLKLAKDGYSDVAYATSKGFDSDFEESVACVLTELGYEFHPQVGMAGFFVDIGVLDPCNSGRYLLGVECDGAAYHSSRYARDRDRLRQQILESRGWSIHRIWSTDWFYRQEREVAKLKDALEKALSGTRLPDAQAVFTPEPVVDSPAEAIVPEGRSEEPTGPVMLPPYAIAEITARESSWAEPHELATSRLAELVTQIVAAEQPIHEEEVARRLAAAFGRQKAGSRIRDAALRGLKDAARFKNLVGRGGFWKLADAAELPARSRSHLPAAATVRKPDLICPTEIAAAARVVLAGSLALEQQELIVETARALGFARTGSDVADAIKGAIKTELMQDLEHDHMQRLRLSRL